MMTKKGESDPDCPELPSKHLPSDAAAPTTTHEQDRATAGQRSINRAWEYTQAGIAITVTGTGMIVAATLALRTHDDLSSAMATAAFVFVTGAVNLVIGFYFGRTNHTKTGGVGDTENKQR